MENLKEKLNVKILLVGFLILIFISGIVFLLISTKPKGQVQNQPFSVSSPSQNLLPTKVPQGTSLPQVTWQVYQTNGFEISYPSDWKTETFSYVTGGVTTRVKPNYLSKDEYYPSIDISVENSSSAANLENSYVSMPAFRKIGNKYRTTSMTKMVGKEKINSPVQEVAVFINNGEIVYFFEYKYDGEKENGEFEAIFSRIISSLKPF